MADERVMTAEAAGPVAAALGLPRPAVARTVELLDGGNTIPFIARYRKEATGGLDGVATGHVAGRVAAWRALEERRADVRRLIEEAGALTPELDAAIAAAPSLATLDDLYLPYRPKRRTRATIARQRGLEPLAQMILAQERLAQSRDELGLPFVDPERVVHTEGEALAIVAQHFAPRARSPLADDLRDAAVDAYRRLIAPSLERETRTTLTEVAEEHAIGVFARNLRALLLQPPLRGRTVLGIDPGFRTGCKVAVVDPTGKPLAADTIYPHPPQNKADEALATLHTLVAAHGVSVIAIGNGTASRETEHLVARLIDRLHGKDVNLAYAIVSEAGASVYSASPVARAEFPDLDVTARGTISIARRLQDPLAELVKVPPQSIGVGLYQHDGDQKQLKEALDGVVESCVNYVGVDLNTAWASLLTYVAGVGPQLARGIVQWRNDRGAFATRAQLMKVPKLGPRAFQQAAGFLKVPGGTNPLEDTFIHPESYGATERLIALMPGATGGRLSERAARFRAAVLAADGLRRDVAAQVGLGEPTLLDVLENLAKPG